MDFGKHFPISEYYRHNILAAETISHTGTWWSAVLLIKDPKTEKLFAGLYRWQQRGGKWKTVSNYKIRSKKHLLTTLKILENFSNKLE